MTLPLLLALAGLLWAQDDPGAPALNLPGMAPARPAGAPAPKAAPAKPRGAAGIYPVYDLPQGWLLFDRDGAPGAIASGSRFVVVGSKATGVFSVKGKTHVDAACVKGKPGKTAAYVLEGAGQGLGTPIIALRAPRGQALDTRKAKLYKLVDEVTDDTYNALGKPLKDAIIADVKAGSFLFKPDDSLGEHYAGNPDPEKIQLKLDFGSKVRIGGIQRAFVLVEGVNISRSFRRCVRLLSEQEPLGSCSEMPHDLMAETQLLEFVAYDPSGKGQPFVLAYSRQEPLWGHERWGFQLTRRGARRFLMDALDPKCRDRF